MGKRELAAIIETLEAEHDTLQDAAEAVLAVAEQVFEDRAKFVVVGQLTRTKDGREVHPSDPEAVKVSLGWYSTEGDARKASESLWHNTASGDTFRTWVLPVHHGTPADFHEKRKAKYVAEAEKAAAAKQERLQAQIARRDEEAAARAAGSSGVCATCKHPAWEHSLTGNGRAGCRLTCNCEKYKEA